MTRDEQLIEELRQRDERFGALYAAHQDYDRQLQRLVRKSYLTAAEELEEARLKKLKLSLKDEMYVMLQEYARSRN
ncbi:MAG: DUF465 domain-containing protein [Deltaproteobacteria bacterium]|nr:DUF465 domain-containing protein [Deltaproteobacteria bacterium]